MEQKGGRDALGGCMLPAHGEQRELGEYFGVPGYVELPATAAISAC